MQYDANTPTEYIDMLDDDWRRETLLSLRDIVKSKAPEIEEGIQYKMLSYGGDKGVLFHLNAQKNHVSLYVGDTKKVDSGGRLLKGIDIGKGCIRFKKTVPVSETRIDEFIERAVELWRSGANLGC